MNRLSFFSNPWLRSFAMMAIVFVVAIACSKNNGDPVAPTNTMEGNWKVSSLSAAGLGDLLPAITQTYGNCITDVTLSFKTGGTVSYDTPASCTASATSIATLNATTGIDANSKWSQSGNILIITPGTGTPKSFTTTYGSTTAQLQGSGLFAIPGTGTAPANYNFTLELRRL